MASSSNPYQHYDQPRVEDDLIDPDDGMYVYLICVFWLFCGGGEGESIGYKMLSCRIMAYLEGEG